MKHINLLLAVALLVVVVFAPAARAAENPYAANPLRMQEALFRLLPDEDIRAAQAEDGPAAQWPWVVRPFSEAPPRPISHGYLYGDTANGRYVLHTGLDISAPLGTPVLAPGRGQVTFAGRDDETALGPRVDFYGKTVVVQLDRQASGQPVFVLYGHLNQIDVAMGQRVKVGDVLGKVGMTGIAIGPHLHIEVRVGRNAYPATRNPALWLEPMPGTGALAGRLEIGADTPREPQRLLVYRTDARVGLWRVVYTYPAAAAINRDDLLGENFAITDLPAGTYEVVAGRGAGAVRQAIEVLPGELSFVKLTLPITPDPPAH